MEENEDRQAQADPQEPHGDGTDWKAECRKQETARAKIAEETGVPAEFVVGGTEAQMRSFAEKFSEHYKAPTAPARSPRASSTSPATTPPSAPPTRSSGRTSTASSRSSTPSSRPPPPPLRHRQRQARHKGGWAKVCGDEVAASAIADRVCHHWHMAHHHWRTWHRYVGVYGEKSIDINTWSTRWSAPCATWRCPTRSTPRPRTSSWG